MKSIKAIKKSENIFEIPRFDQMKVSGIIFASDSLMKDIQKEEKTLWQLKNVASLPGICSHAFAMPDAHQGYGFPIGGVAAFNLEEGIISPGGVGYDINCGVRLLTANLSKEEFLSKRKDLTHDLMRSIPTGVGRGGTEKLTLAKLNEVLSEGADWCLKEGYATKEDIEKIEDNGRIKGADPSKVSQKAKSRGINQLGSLGAGNHFVEVQEVEKIYDKKVASAFGIDSIGQITVMVHCGSRGLGHQTASDYIRIFEKQFGFEHLPDRELICAPVSSDLGKDYFSAMASAANFAFANRQLISYNIRKVFKRFFKNSNLSLVYDIAHNMAKFETHTINGKEQTVCVHRKGATRSFGPGRTEIPKIYRNIGCPIFIPGSMGTSSYVLVGTKKAEELSFGSTAHGAGRVMSRTKANRELSVEHVKKELEERGVFIEAGSSKGITEEAPEAYKDVDEVVRVSHSLGIGKLVAKLKPLAVIKG